MNKDLGRKYTREYIGKQVEIIDSNQESMRGITGKIVDETMNTFVLDDGKILPKRENTFKVKDNEDEMNLKGVKLTYRPEDRIKKLG
ncbi:MAG: ribonuclease P component 1 family protein [Thermoplasmatota archaeon]